jgi:hypothetical protein
MDVVTKFVSEPERPLDIAFIDRDRVCQYYFCIITNFVVLLCIQRHLYLINFRMRSEQAIIHVKRLLC